MIRRTIGRLAGALAVGCVSALAIGIAPASAAPSITLTNTSGTPFGSYLSFHNGDQINVNYSGLDPTATVIFVAQCITSASTLYSGNPAADCINNTSIPDTGVSGGADSQVGPIALSSTDSHGNPCNQINTICDIVARPNSGDFNGSVSATIGFVAGVVPEAPYAVLLPVGTILIFGGGFMAFRRRRRSSAPVAA
jgi:hypothetical protein